MSYAEYLRNRAIAGSAAHAAEHAALGVGAAAAFTSRALTAADDSHNLICASAQTATVNTGLPANFGCSFKGVISFDGTATVNDVRTTGATNPWCALVRTGVDTYDAVGGKA